MPKKLNKQVLEAHQEKTDFDLRFKDLFNKMAGFKGGHAFRVKTERFRSVTKVGKIDDDSRLPVYSSTGYCQIPSKFACLLVYVSNTVRKYWKLQKEELELIDMESSMSVLEELVAGFNDVVVVKSPTIGYMLVTGEDHINAQETKEIIESGEGGNASETGTCAHSELEKVAEKEDEKDEPTDPGTSQPPIVPEIGHESPVEEDSTEDGLAD